MHMIGKGQLATTVEEMKVDRACRLATTVEEMKVDRRN